MADYQSQSTGSPSSISQHAALAALKNCEPDIAAVVKKLIARKDAGMAELKLFLDSKFQIQKVHFISGLISMDVWENLLVICKFALRKISVMFY